MMTGDIERIREALYFIPASDRDTWVRMGMAIKSELDDSGYDVWEAWSLQDESFDSKAARDVWKSIRGNGKVTAGTLFHEAKAHGWRDDGTHQKPTPEELAERRRISAERAAKEEAEIARERAEAAKKAAAIWKSGTPAGADHPYLAKKHIGPHGARIHDGRLVVPVRVDGDLVTLQFIAADGEKRFLPDGRIAGGYFGIGTPVDVLCIAEGFATGASINEATGYPVAVAFNAGNLMLVAKAMREKFPAIRLIVCADDDHCTEGNPGITKATEAARAVDALVAVPDFGTDRPGGATDFNDMAQLHGAEAVERAIANGKMTARGEDQPGEENATGGDPDGNGWPEPQPLPDGLHPVASFDFAMLPATLKPWAADICERVQCAPDFVAVAIMAGLGSVIGRKLGIRPQARTDWTVTPNQWALVVGRPGVLKSPALDAALAPLKRLAAVATEAHHAEIEEHKLAVKVAKLKAEEGEKAARAVLKKSPGANVEQYLDMEEPEAPALRRYMVNDSTAAALGELHRQNHNGLLVFRDELVSLLKSLDREDSAEARGFYLTGWNGDSPYTFDRILRGMNLHIPAVCLSLLGSTQPGRIAEYIRHAVKGGSGDDGLIQRFGMLVWPDTAGEWRDIDRWPDGDAKKEAHRVYEYLDKLDPASIGAQQDTDHNGEADGLPFLRFSQDALSLFLEWRTDLEAKLRGGDLHPAMESHLAKYRKLVPSLALTLHLASNGTGPVSERATLQALAWAEYLETHARRAYGSVTAPEIATAKAIMHRIRKGDLSREFSSRDVWRPGWAMLSDREQVADALRLLVDFDWLAATTRNDTGGRPGTIYVVNPGGVA